MARVDEISAPSDKVIRFRLKKPSPLLPNALAHVHRAIMPDRIAQTDPMKQISEAISSGPPPNASRASVWYWRRTPITSRARRSSLFGRKRR